jgi:flagellar biosynthetic protein FliQ
MTPEIVTGIFMNAIKTAILLSAPMLVSALVIGLLVSLFQSVTQLNEMTMTFIPKMLVVALALLMFFPWMLQLMIDFVNNLFINIPMYVR